MDKFKAWAERNFRWLFPVLLAIFLLAGGLAVAWRFFDFSIFQLFT